MAKKDQLNKMRSGLGTMLQPTIEQPAEQAAAVEPVAVHEPAQERTIEDDAVKAAVEAAELAQQENQQGHNSGKRYAKTGNASTMGLREGETRYTVILKEETLAKAKELAYLQRKTIRATIEKAVEEEIARYEAEHGVIVPFKG